MDKFKFKAITLEEADPAMIQMLEWEEHFLAFAPQLPIEKVSADYRDPKKWN